MARYHMDEMLRGGMADIVAVCEPSAEAYAATAALFARHGVAAPPNEPDWQRFVDDASRIASMPSSSSRRTPSISPRRRPASRPGSTSCSRSRW